MLSGERGAMIAGGSHLRRRDIPSGAATKQWREPTEWTRTTQGFIDLLHLILKIGRTDAVAPGQFATDEAILFLQGQGVFSQEHFRGEPPAEVQPVDEGQAAHELQSPDGERSPREPRAEMRPFHELQAAHEPPWSHSSA